MKKTINIALLYRRIFLVIYDTIAVAAAAIIALVIRYEFVYANIEKKFLESVCSFLPFLRLPCSVSITASGRLQESMKCRILWLHAALPLCATAWGWCCFRSRYRAAIRLCLYACSLRLPLRADSATASSEA